MFVNSKQLYDFKIYSSIIITKHYLQPQYQELNYN